MDIIAGYGLVGSYRGAAQICGTTHRTVKKVVTEELARMSGQPVPARKARVSNTEVVRDLVSRKVAASKGRISAKRLLPVARAAGYEGSDRNFRRLVADAKRARRRDQSRSSGRRPAVWSPGEHLVIDWGVEFGLHVFCAIVPWSRFRFVRFAADETAATTLRMLAECFEVMGGVPKVVLADRMACLKGGVVANRVIPTPDYVRFATHYRFRPDFCEAADPESKGIVEALVNYAKAHLLVPLAVLGESPVTVGAANAAAIAWCAEVNAAVHSETMVIPAERLATESTVWTALPSLGLRIGPAPVLRKVDRLSCIRLGSARYSVPTAFIGSRVEVDCVDASIRVIDPVTGEIEGDAPIVVKRCSCCSLGIEPGVVAGREFGVADLSALESGDGVDRPLEVLGDCPHRDSEGVPSRAQGADVGGRLGVGQGVVDLAGDVSLEASDDVSLGQALGGSAGDVVHGGLVAAGHADQDDAVERGIRRPVSAAVDAVAGLLAA